MQSKQRILKGLPFERHRLAEAYRLLVNSIREAQSMQTVLEKERQMRRLMHYMNRAGQS